MSVTAIVGGVLGGLSALGNGVSAIVSKRASAREAERARGVQRDLLNAARADYLRESNSSVLSRSDAAQVLERARREMSDGGRRDRQRALVSGATGESQAQMAGARAGAYGDAVSRIGALGQRVKDNALARWQAQRTHYANTMSGMHDRMARSHAVAANNALKGVADAVGSVADNVLAGVGGSGDDKDKQDKQDQKKV